METVRNGSTGQLASIKRVSLIGEAVDALTQFVVGGSLEVGDFLPSESALCGQLGISRSTLREAVKVLESRGLVERVHGRGIKVVDESEKAATDLLRLLLLRKDASIQQLVEVRGIFEAEAAAMAAQRAQPADIREIERALEAMLSEMIPVEEYIRSDLNFHLAIAKATYNQVLVFVVEAIRPLMLDAIRESQKDEPRPEPDRGCHKKIFEAIRNGDAERAAAAMHEHQVATKEMLGMGR